MLSKSPCLKPGYHSKTQLGQPLVPLEKHLQFPRPMRFVVRFGPNRQVGQKLLCRFPEHQLARRSRDVRIVIGIFRWFVRKSDWITCSVQSDCTDEPTEYPYDDTNIPAAPGKLVLGKSTEEFLANLSVWAKSDYESHWARELKMLLEGNPKVALVVSYYGNPASTWRFGEHIETESGSISKIKFFGTGISHLGSRSEIEPIYSGPSSSNSGRQPDFRMGCTYSRH